MAHLSASRAFVNVGRCNACRSAISPNTRIRRRSRWARIGLCCVHAKATTCASTPRSSKSRPSPLDFLIADYALSYPFVYGADERLEPLPYQKLASPADQDALRDWVTSLGLKQGPIETYALLAQMNGAIAAHF